jgi:hypothetical protein
MKKRLVIKTGSIGRTIKILERLETLGIELDAEGKARSITLTVYGEKEDIRRALRKLRQINNE